MTRKFLLSAAIVAASVSISQAADFTVPTGATVGQQTLTDIGDSGLIENGGTISSPVTGVVMFNADQTVTNYGLISTSGFFASGIGANGANAEIENAGVISTTGTVGLGIFGTGNDAIINNRGQITTSGVFGVGILTTGLAADITNNGTILTSGISGHGIYNLGIGGFITNSGIISTTGINGTGVLMFNSGTLINSGIIAAQNANAIQFFAGDDTLTLLPGSEIDGAIDLGGGTNTLNVGNGLNLAATFIAAPPVIGTTNGAPFVINGNQVIVVDPTGFAASDIFLGDVTSSILHVLDTNAGKGMPMDGVSTHSDGPGDAFDNEYGSSGMRGWVSGFGGYHMVEGNSPLVGVDHAYGGLIAGVESGTEDDVAGFFGGGALARMAVEFNAQDVEVDSIFGGIYANRDYGSHWINLGVIGGWAGHDTERRVANNLVAGGIEIANGDYDSWFVAPSVTFGAPIVESAANSSLRLNYAGLFLEGYTETGITNPLTISERDIHLFGARAQLALPTVRFNRDGSHTLVEWRIGADGQFNIGSNSVAGTVAGLPLNFAASFDDKISGFLGASFTNTTADGMGLITAAIEGHSAFDGGYEVIGEVRVTKRF